MSDALTTWATHADPFTTVVRSVTDWDAASPCEEWTARDVVAHVIDSQRGFLSKQDFELPAPTGDDPGAQWTGHEAQLRALISDPSVADKEYESAFGRTTVGATLATFHGFDLLVHRWDLAASQGRNEQFTPQELEEIDRSVDGFGEHAYDPGVFARPVDVPEDADRQTRVLARTGRAPLDS